MIVDETTRGVSLNKKFFLLCSLAHGRRNWLLSDTPRSAKASCGIYTIVCTARANGLMPMRYLELANQCALSGPTGSSPKPSRSSRPFSCLSSRLADGPQHWSDLRSFAGVICAVSLE